MKLSQIGFDHNANAHSCLVCFNVVHCRADCYFFFFTSSSSSSVTLALFFSGDQSYTNEREAQPATERCRQQLQHGID